MKNSKIDFQDFLGLMVQHIWSNFHVSSLIFEERDLLYATFKKTFLSKMGFLTSFGQIFGIPTFVHMKPT